MRWLLLDSFDYIDAESGRARASRAITRAEDFFDDYFNFFPVLPPTLLIEMIAQTGGVLVGASIHFSKEIILGKIDWARFYAEVMPPSLLAIEAWITDKSEDGTRIEGKITNQDQLVAEASILLGHLEQLEQYGMPRPEGEISVVFSNEFMNSYKIKDLLGTPKS
ncbi:MAG: hypothetical protein HY586_05220 [Candidatus Omnitrophica bacterium]|nr:hypothetical protein [Candidatus Omnitrophota bacterium]